MISSVLMLCTGNICRSPAAEAMLRSQAADALRVESAGVMALQGSEADPLVVELMAKRGLSLEGHRGRQIDSSLAREFDLLLAMEQEQVDWVHTRLPWVRGRIHRLGKWRDQDIPDPYQGTRQDFEGAIALIGTCLEDWRKKGVLP